MGRELTGREREVLAFMVESAVTFPGDRPVTTKDRQRWRAQLASVQAGSSCGCGTCPSIGIEDGPGSSRSVRDRVVLTASHPDATLLLFIDGDRFSYLELAPHGDDAFTEFPPVADLTA